MGAAGIFTVETAAAAQANEIAPLVGALLDEIMQAIGSAAFRFDLAETTARLVRFIDTGKYTVLVARAGDGQLAGFLSFYESFALYAGGAFGTVPEFYVAPAYRSHGAGKALLDNAKQMAQQRGWTRIELTTPPLPQFDRTLAFYSREGFVVSGGRKLKFDL